MVDFKNASDNEFAGGISTTIKGQFAADMKEIDAIAKVSLPSSLTPSDLAALYTEQARVAGDLFRLSSVVTKWQSLVTLLVSLRDYRERCLSQAVYTWLADINNLESAKTAKTDAARQELARLALGRDGISGIEFAASIAKGYHSTIAGVYARLEDQVSIIQSQFKILSAQLGIDKIVGGVKLTQ